LIFKTARKLKEDPPKTKDEALTDSMTLDEILYRFELDLPKGKNGKN
jgi:hypothetical protein